MPRRVAKNVFDVNRLDRDAPSEPAADAALEGLLPRVSPPRPAVVPAVEEHPSAQTPHGGDRTKPAPPAPSPSSRPRGAGGRLPAAAAVAGITAVAARVPAGLYEAALPLVKGVGKPSWGQLIAWTCQDHPGQVTDQLRRLLATANDPRRIRGQNQQGSATTQVTARMLPDELAGVDGLLRQVAEPTKPRVTRTMVVIAALTVATQPEAQLAR